MKVLEIFEQDCCANIELCSDSLRRELERVAAVISVLEQHQLEVKRHRPATSWAAFQNYPQVYGIVQKKGLECCPLVTLNGRGVMYGRYPTNEEFAAFLDIPLRWLTELLSPYHVTEMEDSQ